ncbi:MAG: Crp/Fnr family transcriptional regulator [Bdellovibrio sp.]|nr:MAG: Crp/Fnr family transcriptional regulator [Bdellovibrio sp.]
MSFYPVSFWPQLPKNLSCHLQELSQKKTYKKGEYLYHMGDSPKGLFLVHKGLVGLYYSSEEGNEFLFRVFGKGSCLGHRTLIAQEAHHASAKVLEPAEIGWIPPQMALKLLETNHEFMIVMLKKLATELRLAEIRLASSKEKQAAERIAETMLYLKDQFPEHLWTRAEIAHFSGTTPETVIRTLSKFEKEGLIQQKGRHINILKKEQLAHFAHLK